MEFVKYPHIGQFKDVVDEINRSFVGQKKPSILFEGTVKLHGTNAAVGMDLKTGELWYQSRTKIITRYDDNAGFAAFMDERKDVVETMFSEHHSQLPELFKHVMIYGEWCGKGIQKGVAINALPRMFVVFDVAYVTHEGKLVFSDKRRYYTDLVKEHNIFSIDEAKKFYIDIDFEHPELSSPALEGITQAVEKECPVALDFGIENGVGEGIVWRSIHDGYGDYSGHYMFKTKGALHRVVKSCGAADCKPGIMPMVLDFVEYVVTQGRLEHAWQTAEHGGVVQGVPVFTKWVVDDVLREEVLTVFSNNLEKKEVTKAVGARAKSWYMERIGYGKP